MQEVKHSQILSHAFTAIKSHLFYPSKQIFRDGNENIIIPVIIQL